MQGSYGISIESFWRPHIEAFQDMMGKRLILQLNEFEPRVDYNVICGNYKSTRAILPVLFNRNAVQISVIDNVKNAVVMVITISPLGLSMDKQKATCGCK